MTHAQINAKHPQRDKTLTHFIDVLIHSDLDLIGRVLLRVTRLFSPKHPLHPANEPKAHPLLPTGPFLTRRKHQRGDLLAWVPRRFDSYLIDDLTGQYGYSHISVDCGENDLPTGKPVMVESTVGQTVQRKFINEYGERHYARIPLSRVGIDPDQFCDCVKNKIGEQYDALEALTLGEIDDPAKQVCSDLAAVCLPEEMRKKIALSRRIGLLKHASVSLHSRPSDHNLKEFISPNGFAQFFGAPPGRKLTQADQWIDPRPVTASPTPIVTRSAWRIILMAAVLAAAWLWLRNPLNGVKARSGL